VSLGADASFPQAGKIIKSDSSTSVPVLNPVLTIGCDMKGFPYPD
jgi:hypothetical protein